MMPPVSPQMQNIIKARLRDIEAEDGVRILLAVESGSRAWGFHSPDSDYDVRFIYARPPEWRYRLDKTRDVIERPIDAELDISGWELSKALKLALNSNAVVAEWLQSPIVYQAHPDAVRQLTDFCAQVMDRSSVTWHYLSLFNRQSKRLAHPEGGLRFKRWFYMLRPAMALRWMRVNASAMPPMDIDGLRRGCALPPDANAALDAVLARKMAATESDRVDAVDPVLSALIHDETEAARTWLAETDRPHSGKPWDGAAAIHRALTLAAFP